MHLTRVEALKCTHYFSIFDYGAHPKRVYAVCLYCRHFAVLSWSDPYGRVTNRIIGSLPAIFTLLVTIITVAVIVISILPYLPPVRG